MKVTITYKDSNQISQDYWETHTEVIHVNENHTIKEICEKYFITWGRINVELHIEKTD